MEYREREKETPTQYPKVSAVRTGGGGALRRLASCAIDYSAASFTSNSYFERGSYLTLIPPPEHRLLFTKYSGVGFIVAMAAEPNFLHLFFIFQNPEPRFLTNMFLTSGPALYSQVRGERGIQRPKLPRGIHRTHIKGFRRESGTCR